MHFVYILYSPAYDKYYVGQTADVVGRLDRHNGGHVLSTRPYIPFEMKLVIEKATRSEAVRLEKKLKNLSKERLVSFISRHGK